MVPFRTHLAAGAELERYLAEKARLLQGISIQKNDPGGY